MYELLNFVEQSKRMIDVIEPTLIKRKTLIVDWFALPPLNAFGTT